jgi:phosphatidylserine decarboxylase
MKIHKEGYIIILIALLILSILDAIFIYYIPWILFWSILVLASLIFFGLIVYFFRVPNRTVAINDNNIIAPSDGKLVVIENVFENEFLKTDCVQLSIFMSPLNIHKQWYPINGIIEYLKYHEGKYLVAWHPKSSIENERSSIVVKSKHGKLILFRQIAGAVARRICIYAREGEQVSQADEAGFIKFGSRIDVFIPKDAHIKVNINQKIIGGQTILASF